MILKYHFLVFKEISVHFSFEMTSGIPFSYIFPALPPRKELIVSQMDNQNVSLFFFKMILIQMKSKFCLESKTD